ncbi:MAG: hypothetical protein CMK92_06440 [Pseudomonas sp.]|nr:hypothetical protein [Pseudomonas sp.]
MSSLKSISLNDVSVMDFEQFLYDERLSHMNKVEQKLNYSNDEQKYLMLKTRDLKGEVLTLSNHDSFYKEGEEASLFENLFHSYDNELSIRGSVIDTGTGLLSLIRVDSFPDKGIREFHLDTLSEEYVVMYKKIPVVITEKKLSNSYLQHVDVSNSSKKPDLKHMRSANEAFNRLGDLAEGNSSHFEVQVWLISRGKSEEELRENNRILCHRLKETKHSFILEKHALNKVVREFDIYESRNFRYSFEVDTKILSRLLPLNKEKVHEQGVPFTTRLGNIVNIDFFHLGSSNYNWLFTGESGKGKSYVANYLAFNLCRDYKDKITIGFFDLGASMEKTASYLGAESFSEKINPFLIKEPEFIYEFILLIVGKNEFDKHSRGELYGVIKDNLDSSSTFKDFISLIDEKMTSISNISFYFSRFFDYFTEEVIEIPSIYYLDFNKIPKDLLAGYVLFVRTLAQKNYDRIANFYDEMWYYLQEIPETLRSDAKTARKKLEANFYFTQEVNELFRENSDASNAIIGNTYGKGYFHQPYIAAPILNDEEKQIITSSVDSKKNEYSEFYVKTNDFKKILRLYPDPLIYELAQSEKEKLIEQKNFLEKLGSALPFREAFNLYVRGKYYA